MEQHVKFFRNGRNKAVRIPRAFELVGDNAIMRKEGDRLIIEALGPKSLLSVLANMTPIDDEFPFIEDLPPEPVEL